MNRGDLESRGFTIVEILIVLAVSGFILLAAIFLIAGKTGQTGFEVAINDIQSKIQDSINNVSAGYYPSTINLSCTSSSSSGGVPLLGSAGSGPGTNSECIYLGTAIQFFPYSPPPKQNTFIDYTIVGVRCMVFTSTSCTPLQNLSQSAPSLTAPGSYFFNAGYPSDYQTITLENGVTIKSIQYCPTSPISGNDCAPSQTQWIALPGNPDTDTVMFIADPTQTYNSGNNALQSGQASLELFVVPGDTTAPGSQPGYVDNVNNYLQQNHLAPATLSNMAEVQVCFVSASSNQSALLDIQTGGGNLNTLLYIKGDKTCA